MTLTRVLGLLLPNLEYQILRFIVFCGEVCFCFLTDSKFATFASAHKRKRVKMTEHFRSQRGGRDEYLS